MSHTLAPEHDGHKTATFLQVKPNRAGFELVAQDDAASADTIGVVSELLSMRAARAMW